MARLPFVDPATAPQDIRDVLDRLPVKLGVFRMMANADTCFRSLLRLGSDVLGRQQLSAKLRELAILRVATLSPARYEWVQHVPIAKAVGATDDQVTAIERSEITAECFDVTEQVVLRFTDELVRDVRVSDSTLAAATTVLSTREIVELIVAVSYYMMIARLLETTGVDMEPAAGTSVIDSIKKQP